MKRKTALYGVLVALAFVFSYIETLLPSVGIPGVKLGLANVVVLVALYGFGARDALVVALVRVVLVGFTFGNPASLLYSLAGGLLSFAAMAVLHRSDRLSVLGVSVAGGVCHNLGQLAVAALVLRIPDITWYLPVLVASGVATGALVGLAARLCLPRIKTDYRN